MDWEKLEKQIVKWRHTLHTCPEEAMKEKETSDYVAAELEKMGLEVHRGIGGYGLVASLTCGDGKGVIGLRADMDAIGYEERRELPYKSKHPGWMHACGHDGHMSMLLGAAKILTEEKGFNGTVRFVFQPGEEPGLGAKAMIKDGLLEKFPMDEIYGMHNSPADMVGKFATKAGGIQTSEDDFEIRIHGKGAHASAPHMSKDVLVIAAEIIMALQTIVSRIISPLESVVVSCTNLVTDGIRNAIPGNAVIYGDVRCYKRENQDLVESQMRKIAESICSIYGAACEVVYSREFIPVVNNESCTKKAVIAAERVFGKENVDGNCTPATFSEDFAIFSERIPGCYSYIGVGEDPAPEKNTALHDPNYDFNDKVLVNGARYFAEIARVCLPK